jgi:hypothetical protein
MWTLFVMKEQYTVCQHSAFFVLLSSTDSFSVTHYPSGVIIVPCCINSIELRTRYHFVYV